MLDARDEQAISYNQQIQLRNLNYSQDQMNNDILFQQKQSSKKLDSSIYLSEEEQRNTYNLKMIELQQKGSLAHLRERNQHSLSMKESDNSTSVINSSTTTRHLNLLGNNNKTKCEHLDPAFDDTAEFYEPCNY
jgi:hypothetical protein